jgi:hypothetical protein
VKRVLAVLLVAFIASVAPAVAQQAMPNAREMSGVPLEVAELPQGTLSVRVIRGGFDKNIVGQAVEFTIDGKKRVEKTDESGRTQVTGLRPGTKVTVVATVDAERLESREITIGNSGIKVALVATDPDATKRAAEDARLAAGPAVKGTVVLGPQSRFIAELNDDQLNIFYLIDILNTARTPVDIGGPVLIDLPREARGAGLREGSTPQATVTGTRVTVTGPFAPGPTSLQVGFGLPFNGDHALLRQKFPVPLESLNLIVSQPGGIAIKSAQIANMRTVTDQGATWIAAVGPTIAAGQTFDLEITGLPHHATWPRNVALGLSGTVIAIGIWAAVFPRPRRRAV